MSSKLPPCGSSCLVRESCVINAPIGKVWENFREFNFDKMAPSVIKSVKFLNGDSSQINSKYEMVRQCGRKSIYKIVELSELARCISVELVSSDPKEPYSWLRTTFKLEEVTCNNESESGKKVYFNWKSIFSCDISNDILKDKQASIRKKMSDIKKSFEMRKVGDS